MTADWSDRDLAAALELVTRRTGVEFPAERRFSAEGGVREAMLRSGRVQIQDYLELLRKDPSAVDGLIDCVMVGETYFFRDPHHFMLLRERWLPEMRELRAPEHMLGLWSAACASGEEAYSLAMMLDEAGASHQAHVLGTDVCRPALALAQCGLYRGWSLRDADAGFIARYFRETDDRYALDERIRRMVAFEHLNLLLGPYPSRREGTTGLDLILCRNVLLYFSPEIIRQVASHLYAALADGGWLLTGPSDPVLTAHAPFELRKVDGILVHRRRAQRTRSIDAVRAPPPPSPPPVRPTAPQRPAQTDDEVAELAASVRALADMNQLGAAELAVLDALKRYPLAKELLFLYAVILGELGRYGEAVEMARRLLFLDRKLALAHFLLGTSLQAIGDRPGAKSAFESAWRLCGERPAQNQVTFSDGQNYGRLAQAVETRIALLDDELGDRRRGK